jgi:hypothetical protein
MLNHAGIVAFSGAASLDNSGSPLDATDSPDSSKARSSPAAGRGGRCRRSVCSSQRRRRPRMAECPGGTPSDERGRGALGRCRGIPRRLRDLGCTARTDSWRPAPTGSCARDYVTASCEQRGCASMSPPSASACAPESIRGKGLSWTGLVSRLPGGDEFGTRSDPRVHRLRRRGAVGGTGSRPDRQPDGTRLAPRLLRSDAGSRCGTRSSATHSRRRQPAVRIKRVVNA